MFEYRMLSLRQQADIATRKLLELEAEHARLELELRLAHATGIENDSVHAAQEQLDILVRQIATLTSWLIPAPETVVEAPSNGQRPVTAE